MLYRQFYNNSSPETLKQLYLSLVRPHLEYSCQLWDPYIQQDINRLESIQKFALKLISHRWESGYEELISFFILEEVSEPFDGDAGLNHARYDHGKHGEREAEDVEEGESNEGFVCRQSFVWVVAIHQSIGSKCSKRNLNDTGDVQYEENWLFIAVNVYIASYNETGPNIMHDSTLAMICRYLVHMLCHCYVNQCS